MHDKILQSCGYDGYANAKEDAGPQGEVGESIGTTVWNRKYQQSYGWKIK